MINPIIEKISHANLNQQSASLNVDVDRALQVIDVDRTKQANA